LGKLDAFNLFDPHWMDPEYDIYYRMLNAGTRLPASTGSDWFISSANRVYAHTGAPFEYRAWLEALRAGKTFISNGPELSLSVQGEGPGGEVESRPGERLSTVVDWKSHYPIGRAEVVLNGKVVASREMHDGSTAGRLETDIEIPADAWIAARLSGDARDSFAQPVFAHTSPVYVTTGKASEERAEAARWFTDAIEKSLEWVLTKGKYYNDGQRREIVDLFREGQQVYKNLLP
jgi:hypothetical protein